MRVALASDHAGLVLKDHLVRVLQARGVALDDLGPATNARVDYPDYARTVADGVAQGRYTFGILCCGSGMGMAIAANKVAGVRAALCTHEWLARMARAHNDANVLCLGERVVGLDLAAAIADAFLATPFEGGRHAERVAKITQLEAAQIDGRRPA